MAALPPHLLDASSTLRELWGIATFITSAAPLLRGGRFRVFMDNLGCVFIMGGVVPAFAVGGKAWGEFVSGGSPDPALQRLALQLFEAQLAGGFTLQAVWVPRTENVRADFLSHASEARQHDYCLLPSLFGWLDGRWGPHTIDRMPGSGGTPHGAILWGILPPGRGVDGRFRCPLGRGQQLAVPPGPTHRQDGRVPPRQPGQRHSYSANGPVGPLAPLAPPAGRLGPRRGGLRLVGPRPRVPCTPPPLPLPVP